MSPIYRYLCSTCGYEFEDLAPMDSVPERPCDAKVVGTDGRCDGTARRVPSAAAFRFNCSMPTYQRPKK